MKNKIKNELIPEIELAKANPDSFIGNIKIKFKITVITKETDDIFAGVQVSLSAKKHD